MKELTLDEKMTLLVEANKLLATIPDYQLAIPAIEQEYNHILVTDKAYIKRLDLEYGEIKEEILGETREEAIASLALGWIVTYCCITSPELLWPNEKNLSPFDKIRRFRAHCESYIYKNIDHSLLTRIGIDRTAFDAINQKAAAILRNITAYDVPLIPHGNSTSSENIYWYKKVGAQWVYYSLERGEVFSCICAENDDEMVRKTVFGSLSNYAMQHFVIQREHNGKDPYRKYDDFMEECLHIVYPDQKYHRLPVYDDRKYAELDVVNQ